MGRRSGAVRGDSYCVPPAVRVRVRKVARDNPELRPPNLAERFGLSASVVRRILREVGT